MNTNATKVYNSGLELSVGLQVFCNETALLKSEQEVYILRLERMMNSATPQEFESVKADFAAWHQKDEIMVRQAVEDEKKLRAFQENYRRLESNVSSVDPRLQDVFFDLDRKYNETHVVYSAIKANKAKIFGLLKLLKDSIESASAQPDAQAGGGKANPPTVNIMTAHIQTAVVETLQAPVASVTDPAGGGAAANPETQAERKKRQKRSNPDDVRAVAVAYVQQHGWPGLNELCRICDCHHSVLEKALEKSEILQGAKKEYDGSRELGGGNRNEPPPEKVAIVDDLLHWLIEHATSKDETAAFNDPSCREDMLKMSDDQLQKLKDEQERKFKEKEHARTHARTA